MPRIEKFDRAARTFETRLLFIKELFENKYTQTQIMAHCIEYKLDESLKKYIEILNQSLWNLEGEDPIKILKKID